MLILDIKIYVLTLLDDETSEITSIQVPMNKNLLRVEPGHRIVRTNIEVLFY